MDAFYWDLRQTNERIFWLISLLETMQPKDKHILQENENLWKKTKNIDIYIYIANLFAVVNPQTGNSFSYKSPSSIFFFQILFLYFWRRVLYCTVLIVCVYLTVLSFTHIIFHFTHIIFHFTNNYYLLNFTLRFILCSVFLLLF